MSEFKRQHPVAAITRVLGVIRQNFITILILLFIGTSNTEGYFLYFLFGGLGIAFVAGIFGWWVFKYRVYEDELQIRNGLIIKNKMYLSKERIQVIDITEGVIQRLFGLVKVEVKTAGGGTETATISAISRDEAVALRTELRRKGLRSLTEIEEPEASAEEDAVLASWKLSNKDLIFAAFTSGNFGLIASILGALSGQLDEFINEETLQYIYDAIPGYSNVTVIISLILAIIVVSWVLSFLGVILRYSDFKVEKTEKELVITSGFLERKHITVPYDRIQAVRFVEGMIRQPFGYGMCYVESAGFDRDQKGRSIVLVPFISKSERAAFYNEFLEDYEETDYQIKPSNKVRLRYIRRPNYLLLLILPVAWYLFDYGWLLLFGLPVMSILGWMRFKDAALGFGDEVLQMRYRIFSRTTAVIKKERIQKTELTQNPFQRRKKVHNLKVVAASGAGGMSFELADIDHKEALGSYFWVVDKNVATITDDDKETLL